MTTMTVCLTTDWATDRSIDFGCWLFLLRLLEYLKTLFCEMIWGWMAIVTKIRGGNLANPLRQLLAVQLAAQRGGDNSPPRLTPTPLLHRKTLVFLVDRAVHSNNGLVVNKQSCRSHNNEWLILKVLAMFFYRRNNYQRSNVFLLNCCKCYLQQILMILAISWNHDNISS